MAQAARLGDGRLHLSDGPIDLIIAAEGAAEEVSRAEAAAITAFEGLLGRLTLELPRLRRPYDRREGAFVDPIAQRMAAAASPHEGIFVTPMAAVAGAVADYMLTAMTDSAELAKAYVNNGGDIAFHLGLGAVFDVGLVATGVNPEPATRVGHGDPVRGIATSGKGGRSFSLGIADAVTVLAGDAAAADVAATLIANAVDLPGHPEIARGPASAEDPDSDLGERLVTLSVGVLAAGEVEAALANGAAVADAMVARGLIQHVALSLGGEWRAVW
ncbi:MAG: UPF0280 family protein [Rhodospirillaceae bacterium]|nr:UPF0280 family protein [Rhodospirillaceae bacterium]